MKFNSKSSDLKGLFTHCILQDLVTENEYWKRAGLGLSEEDALFIQKSMENLVKKDNSIRRIRFFGIFQALKRDYFVIEGNSLKDYKEKLPEDYEKRGYGANSYTYWVSNKRNQIFIKFLMIGLSSP